jgi:hypothetical protein
VQRSERRESTTSESRLCHHNCSREQPPLLRSKSAQPNQCNAFCVGWIEILYKTRPLLCIGEGAQHAGSHWLLSCWYNTIEQQHQRRTHHQHDHGRERAESQVLDEGQNTRRLGRFGNNQVGRTSNQCQIAGHRREPRQ